MAYVASGYWGNGYVGEDILVDWGTRTIIIPRQSMLLLQTTPIEVRQLDLTTFHEKLRALEDDASGIAFTPTHTYKGPTEISGVILAQVVEILEPYTITFEDGQYAVNVTGGNSNVADRVNINNVGVRTANSAGLQDLTSLQAASFSGGSVAVDINSQYSGTIFPVGTRGYPVNNLIDAKAIAKSRGLNTITIMSSMTIGAGIDFSDGFDIIGDNTTKVHCVIEPAADITNCTFKQMTISGTLDNYNTLQDCWVEDLIHVNGLIVDCGISGDIQISGGFMCGLFNCRSVNSNEADGFYPYITWDALGTDLVVRDFSGDLGVGSCLVNINASYTVSAGRIHFEPECNNGTHIIRGDADVYDESGPLCTVVDETIHAQIEGLSTILPAQHVIEMWQRLGLDPANPLTNKPTGGLTTGTIDVVAVVDGNGNVIQTRQ